ncbi:MAG: hypothetical protein LH473_00990 [Chitinophagales bacterium]|nr:hypothetical protein [Chitinophagales bacterium]
MANKITQPIIGGIVATVAFSLETIIAPFMGLPKMSPPEMLSTMMGVSIALGWIMHFMVGIIFAFAYAFLFIKVVKKVSNNILKGAIFGLAVFIIAQIFIAIIGLLMPMPPMEGSMMLVIIGSFIAHIIFGIVVALFVKEQVGEKTFA